jgi:hypothetical protein
MIRPTTYYFGSFLQVYSNDAPTPSKALVVVSAEERRELRQVRKTEFALYFADLLLSIFKSIFAKHLVSAVFELIGDFVVDRSE